jgi:hypothetical protein
MKPGKGISMMRRSRVILSLDRMAGCTMRKQNHEKVGQEDTFMCDLRNGN